MVSHYPTLKKQHPNQVLWASTRSPTSPLTTSTLTPCLPLPAIRQTLHTLVLWSVVLAVCSAWSDHLAGLYMAPSPRSRFYLDINLDVSQSAVLKNNLSTHYHTMLFCSHYPKSLYFSVTWLFSFPSILCWKVYPISIEWSWHPCWKSFDHMLSLFRGSSLYPMGLYFCLYMRTKLFWLLYFVVRF